MRPGGTANKGGGAEPRGCFRFESEKGRHFRWRRQHTQKYGVRREDSGLTEEVRN